MSDLYAPEDTTREGDREASYLVNIRISPDGRFRDVDGTPDAVAVFDNWLRRNQDLAIHRAVFAPQGYVHPNHAESHGHGATEPCDREQCYPGDWPRTSWLGRSNIKTGGN